MHAFALTLLLVCTPAALLDFAIPAWKAEKEFRIEDAYKHLYQATRGGEHAAPDREVAKAWLEREWASMGDQPKGLNEWEPLCPSGGIGRLNLRPFKARGGKADDLLDAFLTSASEYRSEPKAFIDAWAELGKRLGETGFGKISRQEWLRLDAEMKKKDYPAIHHSETYAEANRPAYRIITLQQKRRLIPGQVLLNAKR